MSNLPSPPDNRPLEQLKVSELKDELRKRGVGIKGVKKELIERLEEAIKQEEQGGSVHNEGALKTDVTDAPEEVEGEEEALDGGKEGLSNSPNTSVLTIQGSAPLPELQALPIVSAPDGVPGVSEDREECSTGGNLEANNSVLFVNNAVCENGDADLLPVDAPDTQFSLANASESGKGTSDIECDTGHMQDDERLPNNVVPEVAEAGMNVDVLNESSAINEISVSVVTPCENPETHDNEANVIPDGKKILEDQQPKLESSQIILSETVAQTPIQASSLSLHPSTVMAKIVNEPSGESKSADTVKLVIDERDFTLNEEKPGVQVEGQKCDSTDMTKISKAEVKVEPMEIGICVERIPDVARKAGQELQVFEEYPQQHKSPFDAAQLKVEPDVLSHDNVHKSQVRGVVSGVLGDEGKYTKDVEDSKPAEDGLQDLKRSSEPKQQEPAKRMRRWNSGNRVAVDSLKPLTSGTVKEIMLSESPDGSTLASQRVSPKVVATSRSLPPKVKAESELNSNARTVPPSTRAPSTSLKIERFLRPFTLKAVKDLLAEFGKCTDFWMDQIKTHCFVSYSSVDEAVAARNGLYGRQWPPSVGNFLTADYVDSNEVKIRLEGLPEKVQAPAAPPSRFPDPIRVPLRVSQAPSSLRSDSITVPLPCFSRGRQFPSLPPEPAVPTLEDLFFKTKAKPHIYYLPLTDEQVAEKIKSKQTF